MYVAAFTSSIAYAFDVAFIWVPKKSTLQQALGSFDSATFVCPRMSQEHYLLT